MKVELEQKLYDDFPSIFSNKDKTVMESCMAWGIECNDGWYDIIRSVCWEIKQHEQNINVQQEKNSNHRTEYQPVKFDQVKEKFGGLRIYFSGGDDYVEGVVAMAESISNKTCEICGNKGTKNTNGWILTLCENCKNKT